MQTLFDILTVVSAILMILFILIQTRGASLGAGFGGSGEVHTERRGVDETIHRITIVLGIIFASSILLGIVLG